MSELVTVVLQAGVEEAIGGHGVAAYPGECCGLLIGRVEEGRAVVVEAVRARNVCEKGREPDRYVVEPRDVLAALKAAAAKGLDVVGVYHSHPDHPAAASKMDADLAQPLWAYVIVSVVKARASELRAWTAGDPGTPMRELGVVSWG